MSISSTRPTGALLQATITVTGTQNDLNSQNATLLRCNNATDLTITGLLAGIASQAVTIVAVGSGNVIIKNQDTGSAAANRFTTFIGDITLNASNGLARFVYDGTTQRWRFLGFDPAPYPIKSVVYTSASGPATGANLTETTLDSVTMPANTLNRAGDTIKLYIWGTTAANGNNKTMRFKMQTLTLIALGPSALNNQNWLFQLYLTRITSTTGEVGGFTAINALFPLTSAATGIDFTTSALLEITGQNGTASAGDIRLRGFRVSVEPAFVN